MLQKGIGTRVCLALTGSLQGAMADFETEERGDRMERWGKGE